MVSDGSKKLSKVQKSLRLNPSFNGIWSRTAQNCKYLLISTSRVEFNKIFWFINAKLRLLSPKICAYHQRPQWNVASEGRKWGNANFQVQKKMIFLCQTKNNRIENQQTAKFCQLNPQRPHQTPSLTSHNHSLKTTNHAKESLNREAARSFLTAKQREDFLKPRITRMW